MLVSVHATTVTRSDCGFRAADPFFSRLFTSPSGGLRQRIVGMELADVVEAIGSAVTEFAVGTSLPGSDRAPTRSTCASGSRARSRTSRRD